MYVEQGTAGRPRTFALLGLTAVLLSVVGYVLYVLLTSPAFPFSSKRAEEVAREAACGTGRRPHRFTLRDSREWQSGTIVIFAARCPAESSRPPDSIFGFILLERGTFGWSEVTRSTQREEDQRISGQFVDYETGVNIRRPFAWVQGRVTTADKVAAVEVLFDNGQTMRAKATDGWYVLLADNTDGPCELRAVDARGRVLEQYDLSGDPNSLPPDKLAPDGRGWSGTIIGVSLASPEECYKITARITRAS